MVVISDSTSLEKWLESRPIEVARVVAIRAAARVLPDLLRAADLMSVRFGAPWPENAPRRNADTKRRDQVLPCFRKISTAYAFIRSDPHHTLISAAGRALKSGNAPGWVGNALTSALISASAEYRGAANEAVQEAEVSMNFLMSPVKRERSKSVTYAAIESDVSSIAGGLEASDLLHIPLWPDQQTPEEVAEYWKHLRQHLLDAGESWDVWIDWYDGVLRGDPGIEELEVQKALIPDEIWDQGPLTVNTEIKRLIDEFQASQIVPSKETIASRIRETPQIVLEAAGRYADAARERIRELEGELPSINDPDRTAAAQEELVRLRGQLDLAIDLHEHVSNLPAAPPDAEVDKAAEKAKTLAEQVDRLARKILGDRTTGVGNVLWVSAGASFLIYIGAAPELAFGASAAYLSRGAVMDKIDKILAAWRGKDGS